MSFIGMKTIYGFQKKILAYIFFYFSPFNSNSLKITRVKLDFQEVVFFVSTSLVAQVQLKL